MSMRITPIDESKADDGAWFEYMGVPLKIARSNNKAFRKAFRRVSRPYEKKLRENKLDSETSERLVCEAMAEAVLVDWDATKFPGNVPYSVEAAKEFLLEDIDARDFISDIAAEAENYYQSSKKEKVGNSSTPSNGK
jgi:hypothetical protein